MSDERGSDERLRQDLILDVRNFFEDNLVAGDPGGEPEDERHEIKLATAALIIEMTRADFEISDDERRAVVRGVRAVLGIDEAQTEQLIELARQQVQLGRKLHEFADLVEERYTRVEKRRIVEMMWGVAFSDAELKAHEEYLVRKVAEMLHVPFEDFIGAKIDARERFITEG